MTAVGFLLYMTGRFIWEMTEDEVKTYPFSIVGYCLLVLGITKFLWEKMP